MENLKIPATHTPQPTYHNPPPQHTQNLMAQEDQEKSAVKSTGRRDLEIREARPTLHSSAQSSPVAQSCPTLCEPVDFSTAGSLHSKSPNLELDGQTWLVPFPSSLLPPS